MLECDGVSVSLAGVMLLRNHPWSQSFLARVYGEAGNTFVTQSWWEQAAMHHVLSDDAAGQQQPSLSPLEASRWQVNRKHAQFVPQWWINR